MNFCMTVSSSRLCPSLLYHMTCVIRKICNKILPQAFFLPHTRRISGMRTYGMFLQVTSCADAVTFQKSTGCCYVVPDVLLGYSHSFSFGEKGLVFAVLVMANHTKPGGRMRKLALDLFAKPRFFAEVEFGRQCNDNKGPQPSRFRNFGFRHQASR